MNQKYKILLFGMLAVTLLDALGSLASRAFHFNYSILAPVSYVIYGTTAFIAARKHGFGTGVLFAAILGFFDASVGLAISTFLKADTGRLPIAITPAIWIIVALFNTALGALIGLACGGLAIVIKRK
jgi:hypothetical protein